MVWPLAPASATARVFSLGACSAVAESCRADTSRTVEALQLEGDFVYFVRKQRYSLRIWRTGTAVVLQGRSLGGRLSNHFTWAPPTVQFPWRKRVSFWPAVYMVLENKEGSIFDSDLVELARKTVKPFVILSEDLDVTSSSKTSIRGETADRESQEDSQIGEDREQLGKSRSQLQETRHVLDTRKHQNPFPDTLKYSFFTNLRSGSRSLEATPLAPLPPLTGSLITFLGFILFVGVVFDKWIGRTTKGVQISNSSDVLLDRVDRPKAPTGISVFLERDLKRKESVEWVNMVLGKLWKVYRLGLESWLVGLLQPLIDNLQKPDYVRRVEIKQFFLGDEPLSVRSVERRTSRRANDLQYHIGLRYTGGARMLLLLKLKLGILPITIPVGVRGLDVDGELWVKLRLVPSEPWVGTATWAFVSLPKIKLDLSPFRLFNLMAIPFLSVFLTKLLTQDLPQLFVRPNKNVIDFLKGKAVGPVPKDFKGAALEGNKDFSGELSVTLVDARKLSYVPYGKTDPYVVLILGDQVIRSKKNSQTSVIGPPGAPIWNQDFQLLVVDPKAQRLAVRVRDSFGLTAFTVGAGEVELGSLQDTVPADRVVTLRGGRGPFSKRFAGEILLRLTYKAYVEDEEEDRKGDRPLPSLNSETSVVDDQLDALSFVHKVVKKSTESVGKESITDMVAAVIAELNNEVLEEEVSTLPEGVVAVTDDNRVASGQGSDSRDVGVQDEAERKNASALEVQMDEPNQSADTVILWLGLVTGLTVLVDISLNFSNLLNP